jgi:Rrf2 family protein
MTGNSRFAASVHILAYLAYRPKAAVPSAAIATSVGTNPVVVRRLLAGLVQAQLVTTQKGVSGGFTLALAPAKISLRDVYRAVNPRPRHGFTRIAPNTACPVGARIQAILATAILPAQAAMEAKLARVSLATVHRQLHMACPQEK